MTDLQRFVVSVRIIGAVIRVTPKLKTFMLSVLWSDEAEVIVYRSFGDFKKLHMQLKKKFHHTIIHKVRTIPKFRGKAWKSSQQRGSKRPVVRMQFLESYCDKLLKCDQSVTQSSEVNQFFTPKDHDLQPDFTKNSIMIMPSDDQNNGDGSGDVHRRSVGNVTQPFATQIYRCVEAYETKDSKNRPFKVAVDEKLDVLIKDPAGWWFVENQEKRLAWFPAPYLELLGEEEDDDDGALSAGGLYRAIRSYSTTKSDEVSVPIGSVVEVLRQSNNGWWLIRFNRKSGYIPAMYLQPYNDPHAAFQRKMHSSTLNLDASLGSEAFYPAIRATSTVQSGRLLKAQSLDVLPENWSESFLTGNSSEGRSASRTSAESSFSSFSAQSENSSSSQDDTKLHQPAASPQASDSDSGSLDLSISDSHSSDESVSGRSAPRVPTRPKQEEIMTRCTTMTRKAALATKSRLLLQPSR
ncbi:NADPH oxidase organizer 1-like [Synchiropus splendidus]|uniref:NADPH oxidase organizer 1-like n=1 Tax=Synchiropus splendidus TaxID=270530 RepID=UPI00237D7E5D|nr:NADPH oxidase organizer 1-like [Synchiropus splendidus]